MVELFCPNCHLKLMAQTSRRECGGCHFGFVENEGVFVSDKLSLEEKRFYDKIYESDHGQKWFQGLNRQSLAKRLLEKMSLSYRRERFFKKNIRGKNNLILDLACGAGRDYFKDFGTVVGVDLSLAPLRIAKARYDLVIQSGVDKLPFADSTFDSVVSSDFFGHVDNSAKDEIIQEIKRVLKPSGKTLHVVETDSDNYWFRQAHKYPDLFKKYFINQIGGHIGLEMPEECVKRWKENGFDVIKSEKIWGLVWPIQDYRGLFDNEYKEKFRLARVIVALSKFLSRFKFVQVIVNIFLNPFNCVAEFFTGLNHGQGLMLVCRKK